METNYEHYKKEIDRFLNKNSQYFGFHRTDRKILDCDDETDSCKNCLFSDVNNTDAGSCTARTMKWLVSEYKNPEEDVDWSQVPVDTPVLVRDCNGDHQWLRRYFAKYEDDQIYTFSFGANSWSADDDVNCWKYAKLANPEDCKSTFQAENKELSKEERMEQLSAIYKDSCVKSAWKEMIETVDQFWQSDIDDDKKDKIANMVMMLLRMEE